MRKSINLRLLSRSSRYYCSKTEWWRTRDRQEEKIKSLGLQPHQCGKMTSKSWNDKKQGEEGWGLYSFNQNKIQNRQYFLQALRNIDLAVLLYEVRIILAATRPLVCGALGISILYSGPDFVNANTCFWIVQWEWIVIGACLTMNSISRVHTRNI